MVDCLFDDSKVAAGSAGRKFLLPKPQLQRMKRRTRPIWRKPSAPTAASASRAAYLNPLSTSYLIEMNTPMNSMRGADGVTATLRSWPLASGCPAGE